MSTALLERNREVAALDRANRERHNPSQSLFRHTFLSRALAANALTFWLLVKG